MNKKTVFNELCEFFNEKHDYSDRKLYHKLYTDLTTAGCFDDDYFNNLNTLKNKYSLPSPDNNDNDNSFYAVIPHIDKLSFEECCTLLSFILRAERWSEGWFEECLENGSIQNLLKRARTMLNED